LEAHYSRKKRAGKVVTLIKGFQGSSQELKKLGKTLKNAVGVGGTIKNGEIIIQGNLRDKIMELLKKMGHDVKRVGG
jgi:translation initiation factor 1